jgi:hypothetical protein
MLIIVDRSYLFICVIILANAFAMLFHVSKGRTCMFFFVVVEEIAYVYAGSPPPHPTPSGGKNTCVAFGHSSAATRTEIPPVNTINRFRPLQLF